MFIKLKQHRLLIFSIITFIGIIFYEFKIDITTLLPNLFANTKSFALLANDDQYVTLDNKTKFIINSDNNIHEFQYMDYDNQMINGTIDINSVDKITLIQGNRALELGKQGFNIGAIGGFSLFHLLAITGGEYYFPMSSVAGLMCGSGAGAGVGAVGMGLGSIIPNEESYIISTDGWQFINVGDYIQNN